MPNSSDKYYRFYFQTENPSSIISSLNTASIMQSLNKHLNNQRTRNRQLQIVAAQADPAKVDDLEDLIAKWETAAWKIFERLYEEFKGSSAG